ncbi:MAG: YHS domain-containing protein [Ferruginibacter sp.]
MKYFPIVILGAFLFTACNNPAKKVETESPAPAKEKMETKPATEYTAAMVSNKKDPICGMPVTAGISDTTHYENKAYGFCSAECKDEFKKTPLAYMKEME